MVEWAAYHSVAKMSAYNAIPSAGDDLAQIAAVARAKRLNKSDPTATGCWATTSALAASPPPPSPPPPSPPPSRLRIACAPH